VSTRSSTSRSAANSHELDGLGRRVDTLEGIGPSTGRALRAVGIRDVFDLLCTLPASSLDLRAPLTGTAIYDRALSSRAPLALSGVVEKVSIVPMRGRRAIRVAVRSDGQLIELWWFFLNQAARALTGEVIVAGVASVDPKRRLVRMAHPRTMPAARGGGIEPIYAVPGVASARISSALRDVCVELDADHLDPTGAPGLTALFRGTHAPSSLDEYDHARAALRQRLAWAEAAWLVARRLERERANVDARAPVLRGDPAVDRRLLDALGFPLTRAQKTAIDEISARLLSDRPSRTLLTGDVGTGKTAVLLAAAARAVASGAQVAILAPTTVLADQYLTALAPLVAATSARVALVDKSASDDVDVIVGTHAILSEGVRFARLGLAVVDEQHRLGVGQRLALAQKDRGKGAAHLISVSATPIPRTLALALRGEIATSHLDERPPGRDTPRTEAMPRAQYAEVRRAIDDTVARGERVFVVCATIEESEEGTPGAVARAAELRKAHRGLVALAHGGLDDDEIRSAIGDFRSGRAAILVGTSMLEVGLDVPEATLMVIDGADRLGLAQLHQLRGRVGRGVRPGHCSLVHDDAPSEIARARLGALIEARDGLAVARADLALRGPGDLDGARQAGAAAGLRYLDPIADEELARDAAGRIGDIDLQEPRWEGLRRIFSRLDALSIARGIARGEAG
jgi:ATP-dependent DNA helicase RecG